VESSDWGSTPLSVRRINMVSSMLETSAIPMFRRSSTATPTKSTSELSLALSLGGALLFPLPATALVDDDEDNDSVVVEGSEDDRKLVTINLVIQSDETGIKKGMRSNDILGINSAAQTLPIQYTQGHQL
jgi:hypothetical protein